ncbi:MAG: hypothetical protein ACTSUE_03320 [Promethearchaeota archaeon]
MKLYYLDDVINAGKDGKTSRDVEPIRDGVKFKIVIDHEERDIIPPLENVDFLLERELILNNQRVYSQDILTDQLIFSKITESITRYEGLPMLDDGDEVMNVEYQDLGCVPEGLFFFDDFNYSAIHVGAGGVVKQIDLLRLKVPGKNDDSAPFNKEFKNMLVEDIKSHEWDDLIKHFHVE